MLNNNINSDLNANYEILEKVITLLNLKYASVQHKFYKYKHERHNGLKRHN